MKLTRFFTGLVCLILAGLFGCLVFAGISLRQSPYPIIIDLGVFGLTLGDLPVIVTSLLLALVFAYGALHAFLCGKPDD
jgi:hypothetical protein